MRLEGIYNNFSRGIDEVLLREEKEIKELEKEIEKDLMDTLKVLCPDYSLKVLIYSESCGDCTGKLSKKYRVNLFVSNKGPSKNKEPITYRLGTYWAESDYFSVSFVFSFAGKNKEKADKTFQNLRPYIKKMIGNKIFDRN